MDFEEENNNDNQNDNQQNSDTKQNSDGYDMIKGQNSQSNSSETETINSFNQNDEPNLQSDQIKKEDITTMSQQQYQNQNKDLSSNKTELINQNSSNHDKNIEDKCQHQEQKNSQNDSQQSVKLNQNNLNQIINGDKEKEKTTNTSSPRNEFDQKNEEMEMEKQIENLKLTNENLKQDHNDLIVKLTKQTGDRLKEYDLIKLESIKINQEQQNKIEIQQQELYEKEQEIEVLNKEIKNLNKTIMDYEEKLNKCEKELNKCQKELNECEYAKEHYKNRYGHYKSEFFKEQQTNQQLQNYKNQTEVQAKNFLKKQQDENNQKKIEEDNIEQCKKKASEFKESFKKSSEDYSDFIQSSKFKKFELNVIQFNQRTHLYKFNEFQAQQNLTSLDSFKNIEMNNDGISYLEKQKKALKKMLQQQPKQVNEKYAGNNNNKFNKTFINQDNLNQTGIIQPDEIYINGEIIEGFTLEEMQIKDIIERSYKCHVDNIPFFSEPATVDDILSGENGEFKGSPEKVNKIQKLMNQKQITYACRVRGDGNCFYRSFMINYMFLKIAASQSNPQALKNFFEALLQVKLYEFKQFENFFVEKINSQQLLSFLFKYLKYKFDEFTKYTSETPLKLFMKSQYDSCFDLSLQLLTRSLVIFCFEQKENLQVYADMNNLKAQVLKLNNEDGDQAKFQSIAYLFNCNVKVLNANYQENQEWSEFINDSYCEQFQSYYLQYQETPQQIDAITLWFKTGHYYFLLNNEQYMRIQYCLNGLDNSNSNANNHQNQHSYQNNQYQQNNFNQNIQNNNYDQNIQENQNIVNNNQFNQNNLQNNNNFNMNGQNNGNQQVNNNHFNNNNNYQNQDNAQNQINNNVDINQNNFNYSGNISNNNNNNQNQNYNYNNYNNGQYNNNNYNNNNNHNFVTFNNNNNNQNYNDYQFNYNNNIGNQNQNNNNNFSDNGSSNNQNDSQGSNPNQFQYFAQNNNQNNNFGGQAKNEPFQNGYNQQQIMHQQSWENNENNNIQNIQYNQQGQNNSQQNQLQFQYKQNNQQLNNGNNNQQYNVGNYLNPGQYQN